MPFTTTSRSDADDNQKRRRHRGGRAGRLWRRWSSNNPVLVILLTLFVGLCLIGMVMEHVKSYSGPGVARHRLSQRMRRAKALLHQAHPREEEEEEEGDDEEGDDETEEERAHRRHRHEKEEEEGDDHRPRRRHARHEHEHEHEPHEKKHASHQGFLNRFMGGSSGREEEDHHAHRKRFAGKEAQDMLDQLNLDITQNKDGGIRWIAPYLMLPPLTAPGRQLQQQNEDQEMTRGRHRKDAVNPKNVDIKSPFFKVKRTWERNKMAWEDEFATLKEEDLKPPVDYATHAYEYPPLRSDVPDLRGQEYPDYPPLQPLGDLMKAWPQDNDFPGAHERPIPEKLLHFNYSNPEELEMARKYRDAELPFKLYDIPEVTAAAQKWTDEYVAQQFDGGNYFRGGRQHQGSSLMDHLLGTKPKIGHDKEDLSPPAKAEGTCQESPNNYFAFFQPNLWDVKTMGLPPVRNNDWTFEHWAQHARYADAVALNASKPHFYWQSGVPREERHSPKSRWTFISRDLPSLSSPTKTFFVFEPESQKGIQCRFGERGVVAATHYDSGRNMIAMVTGAKRYILAPPKECPNLGIVPWKFNAVFRHSLLNFGHINYMNETSAELDDGELGNDGEMSRQKRQWKGDHMSQVEREWMEIAASSKAVETVLKAGEVLYIPSHWFHYIVSLQKSAQCNVRSGVHDLGTPAFGGKLDVKTCGRLSKEEALGK